MMENFAKLIQAEWDNIWDFVFGRDVDPEPEPTKTETAIETKTEIKDTQ
jgi:hypothetical protein